MLFHKLKGKNKIETLENYLIALIFLGAIVFSSGVGLTIVSSKGFPIILAMIGAVASFVFTVALIFLWVFKEFKNE